MFLKGFPSASSLEGWQPSAVARLALIILLLATLLNLLERIILAIKIPNSSTAQDTMKIEIAELKRQAKLLNNPETFAQCAKLERKALVLEKQMTKLQADEQEARSHILLRLPGMARVLGLFIIFLLSFKVPIALTLEPEWVWPMGRSLAIGTGEPAHSGFVGLVPWAMVCHRATRAILGPRRT